MTRIVKQPGRGYAGLEKQPLYLYNSDGSFNRKYESKAEFLKDYFPKDKSKRPILDKNRSKRALYDYDLLYDNKFISSYKIGRERLRKYEAIVNCIYCHKEKSDKPIIAYNKLNEKVASFKNLRLASKFTGVNSSTIHNQCNNAKGIVINTKIGLRFKYE